MMDSKKEIIKEIKQELGASTEEITEIVDSQIQYTAYIMEHSGFEGVHWPYFGRFSVTPGRLYFLNKRKHGRI